MRLAALAAGTGIPTQDFAGHVAEVHARAALLAIADGRWATLVAADLGRQPGGITVDAAAGLSFRDTLAPGVKFAARGGVLRLGGGIAIDLRGAQRWRCGLETLRLDVADAPVAQAHRAAWSVLHANGRSSELWRTAGATMDRLSEATRHRDVTAAEDAMSRLIGLGEGRTPAGDDYLVGYFAALWACGQTSREFATVLGARLVELARQTADLSRLYLEAAAVGEVSERIAAVAAGIAAGGDDAAIGGAVTVALAVGHSSGAATVCGLLQGCAAACADTSAYRRADAVLTGSSPICRSCSAVPRHIRPSSA